MRARRDISPLCNYAAINLPQPVATRHDILTEENPESKKYLELGSLVEVSSTDALSDDVPV